MRYMKKSTTTENRHARRAVSTAMLVACLLAGTEAGAQDNHRGGYIGLNLGLAGSSRLDSAVSAVSNPTRCDRLLYDDPALAPSSDPACTDTTPRQLSSNGFSPGPGFTGGFSAGYAFGGPRIEFEYRARTQGGDVSPLIESTSQPGRGQQSPGMEPGVAPDGVDLLLGGDTRTEVPLLNGRDSARVNGCSGPDQTPTAARLLPARFNPGNSLPRSAPEPRRR